jgi:hypothetical protein
MASMSYCMFENTENEMRQVVDAMSEADSLRDLDLNSYEHEAFLRMFRLARNFLAEHERLLSTEE